MGRALKKAGLKRGDQVLEVDEMRLGWPGQVRRVWASRGVKVVQTVQFVFEWVYLLLGVDPRTGQVKWNWISSMRQDDLVPALQTWSVDAVIWDGASSHRGQQTAALPLKRIFQPAYSPELNPVERMFEELRAAVEGRLSDSLQQKQQAIEKELQQWATDPERVKRLAGWTWIRRALDRLPDS